MACGDGPIDAIFLAIEKITGVTVVCRDFRVQAVTVGKDAQAEVNVEVIHDEPVLPRPRRLDRQRRGQRQGLFERDQPHRHSARQATASAAQSRASDPGREREARHVTRRCAWHIHAALPRFAAAGMTVRKP